MNHVAQVAYLEPRSVGVVASDARSHGESEGEGRDTTDLPITLIVLSEHFGLVVDQGDESRILVGKVLLSGGVSAAGHVHLDGVLELVDDLLQQLFLCREVPLFPRVSGNETEYGLLMTRTVLSFDLG